MQLNSQVVNDLDQEQFVNMFGDIYEHSQWVARELWEIKQKTDCEEVTLSQAWIQSTMVRIVDNASEQTKLSMLFAHPDLAGKAALAGDMTDSSISEQSGAGLDQCTEEELTSFTQLNDAYRTKFGFPFIKAVKGATKDIILEDFKLRLQNTPEVEFELAMNEVHKIAGFRLTTLFN
ncbi:2-oxo-4-hydroxy-4-carboxy-5-ureidoimidazoline decarboxylase [Vibrio sp.]|nr:2-oxo-4-hydroxy-4-carboxy-5-ureidoimidazoline decarboxylase [Vibrio sp.]